MHLRSFMSWALAIVVAGVAGFFLWRHVTAPALVPAAHPRVGEAVQAVYAAGTVEPLVMVPVAARAAGHLVALKVDEGAHVRAGQLLAQLDDSDLRAAVAQLQARRQLAQQTYDRTATLMKQGWVTRSSMDQAASDLKAAAAAEQQARAQVRFMALTAPTSGTVVRRDGEIGQFIPTSQPVFFLAQDGGLRVTAEVDEEDIPLVRKGQTVLIRADAFPDRVLQGRVLEVTPKGDDIARSYRVRIALPQDTPLMIGMTADTNILIRKVEDALLIPADAVVGGKVWVVVAGRLAQRDVKLGIAGPDKVQVLSGLGTEDTVVSQPAPNLKVGARVRVVTPHQSAADAPGQGSARL